MSRAARLTGRGAGRDDAGAVAVVVAVVVTLVLLPVAALAVDLGSSYAVAAAVQQAADAAATAGAQELARQQRWGTGQAAAISAATAVAVAVLCHDPLLNPPARPGPWHGPCADGTAGWAFDRDAAGSGAPVPPDGEIEFYTGAPSLSTHTFAAGQRADGSGSALLSGIRVVTPPATVTYGFAGLFGASTGRVQRAATAQLRSVLPARDYNPDSARGSNTRLFLTQADLLPQPDTLAPPGQSRAAWCGRSAPRESWRISGSLESVHPTGVCDAPSSLPLLHPSVPHGLLAPATAGSALTPNLTPQLPLAAQSWPAVSRMRELTSSLFGSGGRLMHSDCGSAASTGGFSGVESAHLADFVNPRVGPASGLKSQVLGGAAATPAQEGWLSPDILRCGRLALVPVLRGITAPPPLAGLLSTTGTTYPVDQVRLLWLDNVFSDGDPAPIASTTTAAGLACLQRGFYWENAYTPGYCPARDDTDAPLRAITGYILDPRLLPATVTGAAAANAAAYVGSGLPATVRLIRDQSDPPAT